jgi:hypothetical protein
MGVDVCGIEAVRELDGGGCVCEERLKLLV